MANNLLGFLLSEPMETYFVITVVCSCNVDIFTVFCTPRNILVLFGHLCSGACQGRRGDLDVIPKDDLCLKV